MSAALAVLLAVLLRDGGSASYKTCMKRTLLVLLGLVAGILPFLAQPSTASAAVQAKAPAPISGRLFVGGNPAAGVKIQLRSGATGTLIGATTTNSEGRFWVTRTGPLPRGGSYVKVVGTSTVQGGVIGGAVSETPKWVQPSYAYGTRYADGTSLGRVYALPAYVRGKVVDADDLTPVVGAVVRLREASSNDIAGYATTDSNGIFRITGIDGEDFNLQVVGTRLVYESGYRACDAQVVPTIGEACGSPIGDIGRVYLEYVGAA